jgi:hypothetical protein
MSDAGKHDRTIKAIDKSDAPILMTDDGELAIYRSEWANEVLSDPDVTTGYKYFIDSLSTPDVYPVNTPADVQQVIMSHYSKAHNV